MKPWLYYKSVSVVHDISNTQSLLTDAAKHAGVVLPSFASHSWVACKLLTSVFDLVPSGTVTAWILWHPFFVLQEYLLSSSCPSPPSPIPLPRLPELKVYSVLASGSLVEESKLALNFLAVPWSCMFDHLDRLWVCLPVEQEPVLCFTFQNGEVSEVKVRVS